MCKLEKVIYNKNDKQSVLIGENFNAIINCISNIQDRLTALEKKTEAILMVSNEFTEQHCTCNNMTGTMIKCPIHGINRTIINYR